MVCGVMTNSFVNIPVDGMHVLSPSTVAQVSFVGLQPIRFCISAPTRMVAGWQTNLVEQSSSYHQEFGWKINQMMICIGHYNGTHRMVFFLVVKTSTMMWFDTLVAKSEEAFRASTSSCWSNGTQTGSRRVLARGRTRCRVVTEHLTLRTQRNYATKIHKHVILLICWLLTALCLFPPVHTESYLVASFCDCF
jgi:hypothetical protein